MTVPFVAAISLATKAVVGSASAVMEFKDFQKQLEQERKNLRREQQSIVELAGERAGERARQLNERMGEIAAVAGYGNISGNALAAAAGELSTQTGRNDAQDYRALGDSLRTIRERRVGLDSAEKRAKLNTVLKVLSLGVDTGMDATELGGAALAPDKIPTYATPAPAGQ